MRRRHLRLIGSHDPANVFSDLTRLRQEQREPSSTQQRRARSEQTFARIPHDRALELHRYKISSAAWMVLIELDRIILKARGSNPVKFWSPRLRSIGLIRGNRSRALRQLEAAGVISVEYRGHGLAPWVTHHWYPLQ